MVDLGLELEVQAGGKRKTFKDAAAGIQAFSGGAVSFDKMDPIIKKMMRNFLNALAGDMRTRHGGAWPGGTGTSTLSKRTGRLVESIAKSVRVTGKFSGAGEVRGQIGSPLVYASTQEFGATIRPKRAKWLTVPLPAAMDKRGIMLLPKARDYPRTFIAKSRKGNLLIFQKIGKRKIIPLFVLKKSVKIPPRLNLGKALELGSKPFGDRVVEKVFREFQAGRL